MMFKTKARQQQSVILLSKMLDAAVQVCHLFKNLQKQNIAVYDMDITLHQKVEFTLNIHIRL